MNDQELEALLNQRTPMERRVYAALREQGRLTDRQLRELLSSRGSGPRDALAKLLPTGIVRHAGRASTPGKPMQYEVTPLNEVESTADKYAVRKPKRTRRTPISPESRLAELRGMEPGDFRPWHEVRQRILSQTKLLTRVDTMAFWQAAPLDELEMVLEEVVELRSWAEDVIAAIGERAQHESVKLKIKKLRATKGRTNPEQETAQRLAEKLSRRLIG